MLKGYFRGRGRERNYGDLEEFLVPQVSLFHQIRLQDIIKPPPSSLIQPSHIINHPSNLLYPSSAPRASAQNLPSQHRPQNPQSHTPKSLQAHHPITANPAIVSPPNPAISLPPPLPPNPSTTQ